MGINQLDLHAKNIIVTVEENPYIIDFGNSRIWNRNEIHSKKLKKKSEKDFKRLEDMMNK